MSAASLKKVEETFIAPLKLVQATKQDLLDRKLNPNEQRKFQNIKNEDSEENYSEEDGFENPSEDEAETENQRLERIRKALKKENEKA